MTLGAMRETRELAARGKGVLAAGESHPTMAKRLADAGLESTEPCRLTYREISITPDGLGEHIGGVNIFETARQQDREGTPFPELLRRPGIAAGSRSISAPRRSPAFPARPPPSDWTGCASASRSTPRSDSGSPRGGPSFVGAQLLIRHGAPSACTADLERSAPVGAATVAPHRRRV